MEETRSYLIRETKILIVARGEKSCCSEVGMWWKNCQNQNRLEQRIMIKISFTFQAGQSLARPLIIPIVCSQYDSDALFSFQLVHVMPRSFCGTHSKEVREELPELKFMIDTTTWKALSRHDDDDAPKNKSNWSRIFFSSRCESKQNKNFFLQVSCELLPRT